MRENLLRILLGVAGLLVFIGLTYVIRLCLDVTDDAMLREIQVMTVCFVTGFALFIGIMDWLQRSGAANDAFLKNAGVDSAGRIETVTLSDEGTQRGREYLRGFADATDFFVRNYLSRHSKGPSEHVFWVICGNGGEPARTSDNAEVMKERYRAFMVYSLLLSSAITEKEFTEIIGLCRNGETREFLSKVLYTDSLVNEMRRNLTGLFDDAKEENHEGGR